MPTTCGFPNCKFRSRYRGQEDNRHFYRIPKRPTILRQAWLNAIGRSEETVVSQLRICSAHFYGGEKHEGDIPVADPQVDPPEFIELPPKESRQSERRSRLKASASSSACSPLLLPPERHQLPAILRPNRRPHRGGLFHSPYGRFEAISSIPPMAFANQQRPAADIGTIFGNVGAARKGEIQGKAKMPPMASSSSSSMPSNQLFAQQNCPPSITAFPFSAHFPLFASLFGGKMPPFHPLSKTLQCQQPQSGGGHRPLVALLDGRDCSIEMPLLKDIATVAFCDAQSIGDVHEKVLNEASAALLYQSINLAREDLHKFKTLKVVVRIGSGTQNVDVQAATELGIAICHTPAECVEEMANSTVCLVLNMFRRTFWAAKTVQMGKHPENVEQLREMMLGSARIRGSTLGLLGLGRVGTAVALRAKVFGFRVLFYDPHLPLGLENALGLGRCSSLAELLQQSDCLSLHCPATPETRHILNSESIKLMKVGSFLVNTGEFELVEPKALLASLKSGHLGAAAFDQRGTEKEVYESLCLHPNVIFTGQSCWYSPDSYRELREAAAQEVRRALTGTVPEDLKHCVNKAELLALKRLLYMEKLANNPNGNNPMAANSRPPPSTSLFSQSHVNGPSSTMKDQSQSRPSSGEIGHSIGKITSSTIAAGLEIEGQNPLSNYPPGLLMMHPQLWQMALLQSQQQANLQNMASKEEVTKPIEDEDEVGGNLNGKVKKNEEVEDSTGLKKDEKNVTKEAGAEVEEGEDDEHEHSSSVEGNVTPGFTVDILAELHQKNCNVENKHGCVDTVMDDE